MREPILIDDLRKVVQIVDKAIYESGLNGRQNTINMIILPEEAIDEIDGCHSQRDCRNPVTNDTIECAGVYNGCYVFSDKQREKVLSYKGWPDNAVWQEFKFSEHRTDEVKS